MQIPDQMTNDPHSCGCKFRSMVSLSPLADYSLVPMFSIKTKMQAVFVSTFESIQLLKFTLDALEVDQHKATLVGMGESKISAQLILDVEM